MLDYDLNLDTRTRCPVCDGDGWIACEVCNGIGNLICEERYWDSNDSTGTDMKPPIKRRYLKKCTNCQKRGYVTCPRCQGSGEDVIK